MPLLLTGRGFRQELERAGALALYAPLEGGAETRLLRRMRAAGYRAQITSARGLGDPEAFLAAPVIENGVVTGVLVAQLSIDELDSIVTGDRR